MRFGEPSAECSNQVFGSQECFFRSDGWDVRAFLLDGRCHAISYLKPGDRRQRTAKAMLKSEQWLELEKAGRTWKPPFLQIIPSPKASSRQLQTVVPRSQSQLATIQPRMPQQTSLGRLQHSSGRIAASMTSLAMLVMTLIASVWGLKLIRRSASLKGWIGEKLTHLLTLRRLDPAVYRVFNNVYLPRPDGVGSTQIDHVVLSPYGIFVIETKHFSGWIYGKESDRQWTKAFHRKKFTFQNPLNQNFIHVEALRVFLKLPSSMFHSIVFLVGDCVLKTELPVNVMTKGLRGYIESHQQVLLNFDQMKRADSDLEAWSMSRDKILLQRNHVRFLRGLHGDRDSRKAA